MNTKDHELIEIDGCKVNKGQAPVVQKVDSAIHWLNIISIYQIRHKKFSRVLIGSRNSEYPQAIHCFVPFSPCSPCSPSSPVAPILLILLVRPNPLVPPVPRFPMFPLFPVPHVPFVPFVPVFPLFPLFSLFSLFLFSPLFASSSCFPHSLVPPVPLFTLFPLFPFFPCYPFPSIPRFPLFPCSPCSSFPVLCSVLSVLFLWRGILRLCYPVSNTVRSVSLGTVLGLFCVCCVCIYEQSFNNFENNTTK